MSDSPDLYLLAHKVRGEPAFDVGYRFSFGDEEGWLLPTIGHRCRPFAYWKIEDLADVSDYPHQRPLDALERMPEDHPDHYSVNDRRPTPSVAKITDAGLDDLLSDL